LHDIETVMESTKNKGAASTACCASKANSWSNYLDIAFFT